MIKKIILTLSLLFLTACVERGSIVNISTPSISNDTLNSPFNNDDVSIPEDASIPILKVTDKDENMKNTLSGSLVLLIGLIILL